MDPQSMPWRALDTPAGPCPDTGSAPPAPSARRLPWTLLAAVGLVVALGGVAFAVAVGSGPSGEVVVEAAAASAGLGRGGASTAATARSIVVEVVGGVARPGVYRLEDGARVSDAIAAAGGYGPRLDAARASSLNLAARLEDGAQVRVPSRDEAAASGSTGSTVPSSTPGGQLDLNRATAAELDTLPGVGPATAAKIIAARQERPFGSVDELRQRGIVGAATFAKLRDLVAVR
ncbi:MAG: helix-hairpin-helix domain-containing protein [Candidatus Limnocylindrales bacterium]